MFLFERCRRSGVHPDSMEMTTIAMLEVYKRPTEEKTEVDEGGRHNGTFPFPE